MPRDERIVTLDLLRGLALLGILLANMSVFGQPQASTAAFSATYDRVADWMTEFLIHGKFNAIFSFLFGYGFTLWMDRGGGQGQAGFALYLRRLLVLFVIGASHYVLLWDGDILHKYALLGVLLLALRRLRWQDTPLLLLAGLLLCADLGHQYVTQYFGLSSSPMRGDPAVQAQEELQRLSAGPYREQVTARLESFRQLYAPGGQGWWGLCSYAGTMVIGFVAGRRQVLQDVAAHEGWLRRFSLGSLFLGLGCGAFFATGIQGLDRTVVTPFRVLVGLSFIVNRLLLSAFYISAFTLLCQRASWRHRWSSLAAVGRMSLTNYLLQSLLCTTLFYSYGLALFGRIGPLVSSLLAFALYGAQVVASNVWARDHTQGPVEWLWRVLTYGRQVLRRGE